MDGSSEMFCNKECEYYPCHKGIDDINCLFCYCPLYSFESCPGNYSIVECGGEKVKDCSECLFPHRPENYKKIIELLGK